MAKGEPERSRLANRSDAHTFALRRDSGNSIGKQSSLLCPAGAASVDGDRSGRVSSHLDCFAEATALSMEKSDREHDSG